MCVITLAPLGVETPWEAIENGACANPDGHGWAVASARFGLVTGKSMDPKAALEAFEKECERQGGTAAVRLFHSRITTHGGSNIENTHPFPVPDCRGEGHDNDTVMAHNGVMPGLWHPELGDKRSDTRVFIDRTAKWYITERGVPSRRGAKTLGQIIGSYNKLVFVSTRQAGKPAVRIINSTSGVWDGGVWFSNTSYKRKVYKSWRNGSTHSSNPGMGSVRSYASTAHKCSEKGCNTTGYTSDYVTCWQHRPECTVAGCTDKRHSGKELVCWNHRTRCAEEGCTRLPHNDKTLFCWDHRIKTSDTKEQADAKKEKSKAVEPYSYGGYNLYGMHAADDPWPSDEPDPSEPDLEILGEETQSLLDDIEEALAAVGHDINDVYEDKPCDVCQVRGKIHIATNLCLACKWCLDCWDTYENCTCFDYQTWMAMRDLAESELAEALAREFEGDRYLATAKEEDAKYAEPDAPMTWEEWQDRKQEIMSFYGLTERDVDYIVPPSSVDVIPLSPPDEVVPTVGSDDDTVEIPVVNVPVVAFSSPEIAQEVDAKTDG